MLEPSNEIYIFIYVAKNVVIIIIFLIIFYDANKNELIREKLN